MGTSKVSIIIPVYNCKKNILKCLQSIEAQSYLNFEVIIVNDGSTDGTNIVISEFIKKCNKDFRLINQINKGSTLARKTGLANISLDSDYFCFCDADDYLSENFLEKMVSTALKENADITQCFYWKVIGKYKYNDYMPECLQNYNVYNRDQIMNNLYKSYFGISNFPGFLHGKLYKNKFASTILELPIIVDFMADDLSINIRLLPLCDRIATIEDKLYYYRNGGGTSRYMPFFMSDYLSYHKLQLKLIKEYSLNNDYLICSQKEIINVLHSWLIMKIVYCNEKNISNEITKWISVDEIKNAINNLAINSEWNDIFFKMLVNNDSAIIPYLIKESNKKRIRQKAKKLIINVFNWAEGLK